MKLVSYQIHDAHTQLGAVRDDRVINLHEASHGELPDNMLGFLQLGDSAMQTARELIATTRGDFELTSVKLLSPITNPSKVIAMD
jgi:hypothetical protein